MGTGCVVQNHGHVGQKAIATRRGQTRPQETQVVQGGFGETQSADEKTQPGDPENQTHRVLVSNSSVGFPTEAPKLRHEL